MASSTKPSPPASLIESAKKAAANRAVDDYFKTSMHWVGIGSGTTILYVVEAIKERIEAAKTKELILFIPTGFQSRQEIEKRGLVAFPFESLADGQMLDVAFDGADECDEEMNLIKGGGACLFQEKLVAMRARKFVCVADYRKDVPRLLTDWTYIPVEVSPIAEKTVRAALRRLGSPAPELRTITTSRTSNSPLKTDQDGYIVMAPFPPLRIPSDLHDGTVGGAGEDTGLTKGGAQGRVWEVDRLADAIKRITGVLEVGIFSGVTGPEAERRHAGGAGGKEGEGGPGLGAVPGLGDVGELASQGGQGGQKPVAVYFGMADGSVKVKKAAGEP